MVPGFHTPLRTETLGPRRWLLLDDLVFHSRLLPGVFVAPRGFQTDLASTPRLLWTLFPPVDRYDPAAVLHDAAYAHALTTPAGGRIHLIKAWADRLFAEAVHVCQVPRVQAWLLYQAVHHYGTPDTHPLAAHRV